MSSIDPATGFITPEDIGEAMASLRGKRTQKDCARRADLERPTWNQYEKGRVFPQPENIERIAQGLGVEVVELTEAVIRAWTIRMKRTPRESKPTVRRYKFTIEGQIALTEADSDPDQ